MSKDIARRFAASLTRPQMGCDPELFLSQGGEVIGSEKVIPEEGIKSSYKTVDYDAPKFAWARERPLKTVYSLPGVVRDGVQAEIQTNAYSCREELCGDLSAALNLLKAKLPDGIIIDSRTVVDVSAKELASLSEKSRVLGCAPSLNIYGPRPVKVPGDHPVRSAGGHIHMSVDEQARANPHDLVRLFDICVGVPSVFLDRDPRAAERREVYGRAGEFRLPHYGIEYRTLSNFWLRSYPLTSFVLAATRTAYVLWLTDRGASLIEATAGMEVEQAINTNSTEKALPVVEALDMYLHRNVAQWLEEVYDEDEDLPGEDHWTVFLPPLQRFLDFSLKGMEWWWPTWGMAGVGGDGWEYFRADAMITRLKEEKMTRVA
jgi:hypothetical protein